MSTTPPNDPPQSHVSSDSPQNPFSPPSEQATGGPDVGLSWIDRQFRDTRPWALFAAALCCSGPVFFLSVAGVVLCRDKLARSRAWTALALSGLLWGMGIIASMDGE